jgi:glycosyltransferase involved in cell wall biosynthesis
VHLAGQLGVERSVRFIDMYMGDDELIDLLQASDVYVTPYLTEAQITSGTLSYAIALGRPIVSTPYWHASEALGRGVGVLCPFGDSECFGWQIADLLVDRSRRLELSQRAWKYGLASRWPSVGAAYLKLVGLEPDSGRSPEGRRELGATVSAPG